MHEHRRAINLNAERQRRYRARLACGKIPLLIEIDEVDVRAALVAVGLLSDRDAEDREKLSRAIEQIIAVWVSGVTA